MRRSHLLYALLCMLSTNLGAQSAPMQLTSPAFADHSIIPTAYTCTGQNETPTLEIASAPTRTQTFALIMRDLSVHDKPFYHWVVFNLPKTTKQVTKSLPSHTITLNNSWGKATYGGPCPPPGTLHEYEFTLYALDTTLSKEQVKDADTLIQAMNHHIVGKATLTANFSRW